MNKRILFATPLICLFLYLIIGFIFGEAGWRIGSCVFLAIPLMPVFLGMRKFKFTFAFGVTIAYYLICIIGELFKAHLWKYAWIVFLLIPIYVIFTFPTKDQIKDKIEKHIDSKLGYQDVHSKTVDDDDDDTVYEAK